MPSHIEPAIHDIEIQSRGGESSAGFLSGLLHSLDGEVARSCP